MPGVNEQSEPAQGRLSISSLAPAATRLGFAGSTATLGSFCLFCGDGLGGLPLVTSVSASAPATLIPAIATATANAGTACLYTEPPFSVHALCGAAYYSRGRFDDGFGGFVTVGTFRGFDSHRLDYFPKGAPTRALRAE